MKFEIGKPVPEHLRNALGDVLGKRDFSQISLKDNMSSESTIRDLLKGYKISEYSHATVHEMVRVARNKCDDEILRFERLKSVINEYDVQSQPATS